MPKRRRRKRQIKWAPVLWLLTIADVAAGLAFSPVTGAAVVRVEGVAGHDRERVNRIAQSLRDVPCLAVDGYAVESRILSLPAVKSAELQRNVFRRAVLKLAYRKPVARVFGHPGIALSDDGVVYRTPEPLKQLPLLRIPSRIGTVYLSFCSGWSGLRLATVCEKIRGFERMRNAIVDVDSKGGVCLNSGLGSRIKLGLTERLDEKLEKLESILRERPGILLEVKELNLISPSRAVKIPRTTGAKP